MQRLAFLAMILAVLLLSACNAQDTVAVETVAPATLKPGDAIPAPTGEVVLTISGKISNTNAENMLLLDIATLEKMGLVKYTVTDPSLNEQFTYTGVLLADLLKVIGAAPDATLVHMTALDEYEVDVEIAETEKWPVLLATQTAGSYMPIESNGPTRIIFPFDDISEVDIPKYSDLAIWNLVTMEIQ